jgi:hypothetical protein
MDGAVIKSRVLGVGGKHFKTTDSGQIVEVKTHANEQARGSAALC